MINPFCLLTTISVFNDSVDGMQDTRLIHRLQERIQMEPTVDMEICPPIRPKPPVSEADFNSAEIELGFSLPPLLRAIYTKVGNGGFGPGYGLIQLAGHEGSLVGSRVLMNQMNEEDADVADWPEQLVQIVNWGCHYFSGVDCSRNSCPILFYDNDRMAAREARFGDCLYPESDSLAEWLSAWLDGVNLWESRPHSKIAD